MPRLMNWDEMPKGEAASGPATDGDTQHSEPTPGEKPATSRTSTATKPAPVAKPANAALAHPADEVFRHLRRTKMLEDVSRELGLDLTRECPVCRSLTGCKCEEDDRTFIRRTRFEENQEGVARCGLCQGPLAVVYRPRDDLSKPPFRLPEFEAVYGCAVCQGDTMAAVLADCWMTFGKGKTILDRLNEAHPLPGPDDPDRVKVEK